MNHYVEPGNPQAAQHWIDRYLPEGRYGQNPGGGMVNTTFLRGAIFRQRHLILATIGLVMLASLVITLLMTPMYRAAATVRIDPYGNNIVQGQDIEPGIASNEITRFMLTQGTVIESKKLAARVADRLTLADDPAFLDADTTEGDVSPQDAEARRVKRRDMAIHMLQANVEADVPIDNRIVPISFESSDPVMAAKVANAYADEFVLEEMRRNIEVNRYAQDYLQDQISDVRQKLEQAELEANAYAKRTGIIRQNSESTATFFGSSTSAPTITASNLAQVNETYTAAKAARIEAEQRWRAVAGTPAMQLKDVQTNTAVQELQHLRGELKRELADLQQRYDDNYPAVTETLAQIDGVESEIARLAADIKSGIRREFEVSARQERALLGERQRVSQQALGEQDRRVRFSILDREAEALRNQLANLLQRYNEIATAANVQAGTVTKLDEADVPESPVSPNLIKNLLVALITGIGLAAGLAVLRETFDERLRSLEEIEDRLGHPLLGHTPYIAESELEGQIENPFSPLMESYSSILTSLDYSLPREKNVLQFTSSQASEGKTTTAILLAMLLARQGRKTLLVDADLRKPSVAAHFGRSTPEVGFAEVLLGRTELQDALLPDMPENLDVLPIAVTPPNPVELLASNAVRQFVDSVRGDYSAVIFDTSPVMGIADAPLLSRNVDATIFIVEANRVQFGQARAALKRLRSVGTNVVGVVLTKYRALHAGQSYDYQYRYYHYTPGKAE